MYIYNIQPGHIILHFLHFWYGDTGTFRNSTNFENFSVTSFELVIVRAVALIAISMYQWFEASDISPIQNLGVSIQLGLQILWSETEIGCEFINCEERRLTVLTDTFLLGLTVHICDSVGPSDRLIPWQDVKKNEDLILIKYQTPLKVNKTYFVLQKLAFVLELIMALKFS